MISYKGWLSFVQYLPNKPKNWRVKAWVLADSKQGYTYNWKLYCGKEEQGREPLGERVVIELLSGLENKGYHVYIYQPNLYKILFTFGFSSCGTVRIERWGIPVTLKQAKPNKGDITTYQDGNVLGLLKWKDKQSQRSDKTTASLNCESIAPSSVCCNSTACKHSPLQAQ